MNRVLPPDCLWRLRKSDGYMDLKMWDCADAELARVPAAFRGTTLYRQLLLRLALERNRWSDAAELADALRQSEPDQACHWVQLAFATRRLQGIEAARSILREAHDRFPREAIIPFNLACYECQLGDQETALRYLREAESLEPSCRALALRDCDLAPLWPRLDS